MTEDAAKRLRELATRADRSWSVVYSRFLDPALEETARRAAKDAGVNVAFFGGYDMAERRVAAFYPEDAPEEADYPVACLGLSWREKYGSPGHRDILGAVMGLGMEREEFGDIAFAAKDAPGRRDGVGLAYLFLIGSAVNHVEGNLSSAGRASLSVSLWEEEKRVAGDEGVTFRATVASTRLDAVIAAGYKLSRSEAKQIIESGLVKKNHAEVLRPDAVLAPGDLVSVRGRGRLELSEIEGETRRGRTALSIKRFG